MRSLVGTGITLAFVFAAAFSCGGSGGSDLEPTIPINDEDAGPQLCLDADHDGFGMFCDRGNDCDDEDPTITDECRRCLSAVKDCPCTPGTPQTRCEPPVVHVDGGTLVCSEGTRYCRDGYWGDCETIGQYVFVAN